MAVLILSAVVIGAAISIALQLYSIRVQAQTIGTLRRQIDEHHDVEAVHRDCGERARKQASVRSCPVCGA